MNYILEKDKRKMRLKQIDFRSDWKKIKKLYKRAFPRFERKPLWIVRMKHKKGEADIWVLEHDEEFVGFAITINELDMVLLDYFAVCENLRSGGLGSQALKLLQEKYADKRFFLEIECEDETAKNAAERVRRKEFYLRNGMSELGVKVNVYTVDMELLGYNCEVSFKDYEQLYYASYGNMIVGNIVEKERMI